MRLTRRSKRSLERENGFDVCLWIVRPKGLGRNNLAEVVISFADVEGEGLALLELDVK